MSGYVVYLDVLLLLNFCMDFLLLWTAGRTLRISTPLWRLLSAACLGGAYASCMVLELPRWLWSPPAAVAVSLLMLALAYPYRGRRAFVRLAGAFYLVSCAAAGAALAAAGLMQKSGWPGSLISVRWIALLTALPVALIIGRRSYTALRRVWNRDSFRARLQVEAATAAGGDHSHRGSSSTMQEA